LPASHLGHFTSEESDTGNHWIGGWVNLRFGVDMNARRKIPQPSPEIEPQSSSL